jgi:hypothetical protein
VPAARLAEPREQHVVRRLEEQDARGHARGGRDPVEFAHDLVEPHAAAHVEHQRGPRHVGALEVEEVHQRWQQARRQVVDAEEVGVLEGPDGP